MLTKARLSDSIATVQTGDYDHVSWVSQLALDDTIKVRHFWQNEGRTRLNSSGTRTAINVDH